MSIVVFATVKAKPDSRDEVAAIYAEMSTRVHEEDGCELYALHTNVDGVYIVEKWASGDALRAHVEGEVVKDIRKRTTGLVEGPTEAIIMRPHPEASGSKGSV